MSNSRQSTLFAVPRGLEAEPEDLDARNAAIDTSRSILVQAPAGAGKTSLLTQRYLALLAQVEEPEQILAITFTRAATAEMRSRIVQALRAAQAQPIAQAGEGAELPLARAALHHAERCNWQLLQQPHRLDVQTIDSLCLRFAHSQPILARLGGHLAPTPDAAALYAAAARRTTALLGSTADTALQTALTTLLLHRDNKLSDLERLLASMLSRRDTWLGVLPLGSGESVDWHAVRQQLEQPFHVEHERVLSALHARFVSTPDLSDELLSICNYCGGFLATAQDGAVTGAPDLRLLRGLSSLPDPAAAGKDTWLALAHLLLTTEHEWRKTWNKKTGFPAPDKDPGKAERAQWKQRILACASALQQEPGGAELLQLLRQLRSLPDLRYSDEQWNILRAAFLVLRRAAAELRFVFAETNSVDFTEIALAAESVLEDETSMRGLLESERKYHLLIDEFQDTSRAQYRLIAHLLREWAPGDRRTVFLVGDPLQSIYAFRQAEVALFHSTRAYGLPCGSPSDPLRLHPCHPLQLTHNFRSHRSLVQALNHCFGAMFSAGEAASPSLLSDTFAPAQAFALPSATTPVTEPSLQVHPLFYDKATPGAGLLARQQEAAAIVRIVQAELQQAEAARLRGESEYKIAILVRARAHLRSILPALRQAGIRYRGIELEPLDQQPEVRDLFMLLRALLRTSDRIAWLSVLRAPWCGLHLADLHLLCGDDDAALLRQPIADRIASCLDATIQPSTQPSVSADGRARLARVWPVLVEARSTRYRAGNHLSLSPWLERTWMALGGPACLQGTARENAETFFTLLDQLEPSGIDLLRGDFAQRLSKLCAAPDALASERFGVQIMTIHKAKGLGFQTVLLPGLERGGKAEANQLVLQLQRNPPGATGPYTEPQLLLAPIASSNRDSTDAILPWLRSVQAAQLQAEQRRLFYVACTRARLGLHLFATAAVTDGRVSKPNAGSLLSAAWPAFGAQLEDAAAEAAVEASATGEGLSLAASAAPTDTLAETLAKAVNTIERLPTNWPAAGLTPAGYPVTAAGQQGIGVNAALSPPRGLPLPLFHRSQGSLAARARGTAMHAVLEHIASLFATAPVNTTLTPLTQLQIDSLGRVARQSLRRSAAAVSHGLADALVSQALAVVASPEGWWLLQPHPQALSESSWQMLDADGNLRTLRVDRCFYAGGPPAAESAENPCLWVIDYKTGGDADDVSSDAARLAWLQQQQEQWSPQLEAYATAIVAASPDPVRSVRYGLYFPELLVLHSWR